MHCGDDHKVVGKGGVKQWIVKPFCYISVVGQDYGCELVCVFLLYIGFEVYDGCSEGVCLWNAIRGWYVQYV